MRWSTALELGRVSNLPTVWTNVLAGAALVGVGGGAPALLALLVAMSLYYVGGMFLNDAFDREIDARERPERPIPSGTVAAGTVFVAGFAMLGVGLVSVALAGYLASGVVGWAGPTGGLALGGAIVLYDAHHKANPLSPLLMGACRMLVYVTVGLALSSTVPLPLLGAAAVVLCYLIGLTYVAKQENLARVEGMWPLVFLAVPFVYLAPAALGAAAPAVLYAAFAGWVLFSLSHLVGAERRIPRAVVSLIAGISLLDGVLAASVGAQALAWGCVLAFAATLTLQRWVSGT
jgi:4-hydroxybenzoate polyprenyltransferase